MKKKKPQIKYHEKERNSERKGGGAEWRGKDKEAVRK